MKRCAVHLIEDLLRGQHLVSCTAWARFTCVKTCDLLVPTARTDPRERHTPLDEVWRSTPSTRSPARHIRIGLPIELVKVTQKPLYTGKGEDAINDSTPLLE